MSQDKRRLPEMEELKMDLSPMIDLVFLLLIFFMIASTVIVVKQDPRVRVPVAPSAIPPEDARGRIVINILKEGEDSEFADEGGKAITIDEIVAMCEERKMANEARGITTKLHLRGDKEAVVLKMKKVVQAAAQGGVKDIIFASYTQD
jgi:biopolymer transport protein ExbD